jgi:hypothetical protein
MNYPLLLWSSCVYVCVYVCMLGTLLSESFDQRMVACARTAKTGDYKVADISLADFGRKEIKLAEIEMPGLMEQAAQGGPYLGIPAHDHSNGGADRNTAGNGCGPALVLVQHLLHARSRICRHRA